MSKSRVRYSKCLSAATVASLLVLGCASTTMTPTRTQPQLQPLASLSSSSLPGLPGLRVVDHRSGGGLKHFVRFGQCQIQVAAGPKPNSRGVWDAADPQKLGLDLRACLDTAIAEEVDVLVLPELALTIAESSRADFLERVSAVAEVEQMIVVAGSYYDADRHSRLAVVGPGWMESGYKVRPSRFEVSPLANEGMKPGSEILALLTDYGNYAVITCVDLISDEVQFLVRSMATRGELDVLININHNPAAWEEYSEYY